jgi:hypothetical protein
MLVASFCLGVFLRPVDVPNLSLTRVAKAEKNCKRLQKIIGLFCLFVIKVRKGFDQKRTVAIGDTVRQALFEPKGCNNKNKISHRLGTLIATLNFC